MHGAIIGLLAKVDATCGLMKKQFPIISTFILFVVWSATARAAEVSGHVRITGRSGTGSVTTVVYAELVDGKTPIHPVHRQLVQKNKTMTPAFMVIPAGSTVDFPNADPIFHNIFSLSRPEPFDLGLYRAGASKSRVFSQPASYRVFCNIHPQMTAVILVVPTSWIAEADESGAYRLDLPPGRYRLTGWSERSQAVSTEITVGATGATADLSLDESGYVEAPHKNKYGQDYSKSAYEQMKH
jgi:plastocyanin